MRLTPGRRAWLEALLDGPKRRTKTGVAFQCMKAGWTEWDYRTPEGEPISSLEARERYGDTWWDHVCRFPLPERITELGRAALASKEQEP